jgi:transcriptional regulator with XRE-family HTH domain
MRKSDKFTPEAAKELRLKLGLTQQEMALLAGYKGLVVRQNWARLESGRAGMSDPRWKLLLINIKGQI